MVLLLCTKYIQTHTYTHTFPGSWLRVTGHRMDCRGVVDIQNKVVEEDKEPHQAPVVTEGGEMNLWEGEKKEFVIVFNL